MNNLSKSFSKRISTECFKSGKKYHFIFHFYIKKNFKFRFLQLEIESLVSKHLEKTSTEPVITICSQIAMYKSLDKLSQWIQTNLTDKILLEEIKLNKTKTIEICEKLASNVEIPLIENNKTKFCEESCMPSEIFNFSKVCIYLCFFFQTFYYYLDCTKKNFQQRNEIF